MSDKKKLKKGKGKDNGLLENGSATSSTTSKKEGKNSKKKKGQERVAEADADYCNDDVSSCEGDDSAVAVENGGSSYSATATKKKSGKGKKDKKKSKKKSAAAAAAAADVDSSSDNGSSNSEGEGSSSYSQRSGASFSAAPDAADLSPVESLQDLLDACRDAREQKWLSGKRGGGMSLSTVRRRLGLPPHTSNGGKSNGGPTSRRLSVLKSIYVDLINDVSDNEASAAALRPLLESTPDEPDGAVVLLQFLFYADANLAALDPDMKVIVDLIAKDFNIGTWCREVLRSPDNGDVDDAVLGYAIAHLQKVFSCIVDAEERLEYALTCILRANDDPVAGLEELRSDLISIVSRDRSGDAAGCMTVTRALYFHNSVETMLFGKNDEHPLQDEHVDVFEQALDSCRSSFPSELMFQKALDQLSPCCSYTFCFRRGPFSCCELAAYCSRQCRDADWRRHSKECDNGADNKVEISFVTVPDVDESLCSEVAVSSEPPDQERVPASPAKKKAPPPPPPKPSAAIIKQDGLLNSHPGIDYFLVQPWGNLAILLDDNVEFQRMKSAAFATPYPDVDTVKGMFDILAKCCPYMKDQIRNQLEEEFGVSIVNWL